MSQSIATPSQEKSIMKRFLTVCFALCVLAASVGCKDNDSSNGVTEGFLVTLESNGYSASIRGVRVEANSAQSAWVIVAKTQANGGTPVRIPAANMVMLITNGSPTVIPSYHIEVEDQFGGTTVPGGQFMAYSQHSSTTFRQYVKITVYNGTVVADEMYVEVVAEGALPIGTLALYNARTAQRARNLQTLNMDDDDSLLIQGVVVLRERFGSEFAGVQAMVTGAQGLTSAGVATNGADATRVQTPGLGLTQVTLQRTWTDTGVANAQVTVNVTNDTTPPAGTAVVVTAVHNAASGSVSIQIQMPAGYSEGASFYFGLDGVYGPAPHQDVNRTVVNGYAIYSLGDPRGPGVTYTITPNPNQAIGTTGNMVDTTPIVVVSQ